MDWDWSGAGSGAIGGAGAGSAFGPIGTAIGGAAGGLFGGLFGGNKKSSETQMQKKQRELVDQLIGSLNGNGPYSQLFTANESDFNKTFREPALANFRNRTAPAIQAQYSGGGFGQQREGTGIQDSLARAGVDMDQLLNKSWLDYQNAAKDRQYNAMNQILGAGSGASNDPTFSEQFVSGGGIGKGLEGIGEGYRQYQLTKERNAERDIMNSEMSKYKQQREGFTPIQGVAS